MPRVMTWNVHGSLDRAGNGNGGNPAKLLPELLATAEAHKPDAIGLQELCYRQHLVFRTELAKRGYRATTMTYVDPSGGCNDAKGGNKNGNALYLRTSSTSPTWRGSAALPYGKNAPGTPGIQPRRIVGARMEGGKTFCVTHLSPGDPDRGEQMAKCLTVMKSWGALSGMVLLGDFNMSAASALAFLPGWNVAGNTIDLVLSQSPVALHAVVASAASDHPQVLVDVS